MQSIILLFILVNVFSHVGKLKLTGAIGSYIHIVYCYVSSGTSVKRLKMHFLKTVLESVCL